MQGRPVHPFLGAYRIIVVGLAIKAFVIGGYDWRVFLIFGGLYIITAPLVPR
jgi:hypothetical protein